MSTVISIINNKGGVGKTTSTEIIAELLAYLGKKVLVIDLDEQSNLSMLLNNYVEDPEDVLNGIENPKDYNVAELFKYRYSKREDVMQLIRHTSIYQLDIIPSSKRHKYSVTNITNNQLGNNNIILKKALASIASDYDYVLIDNAPANNILTVNSMFASDKVIVPVRVEGFSYKGLKETIETILYIKEEHLIDVEFAGAFITQAEMNTNLFHGLHESYQKELNEKFLHTAIRKDIKIGEIETNFQPILEYAPNTNAVFDYANLILELNILDKTSTKILKESISYGE